MADNRSGQLTAHRQLHGKTSNRGKRQRLQKLVKRDGRDCAYCGLLPESYTIDEVVPQSRGGAVRTPNQVLACARCNGEKANMLLSEWTDRWYLREGLPGGRLGRAGLDDE